MGGLGGGLRQKLCIPAESVIIDKVSFSLHLQPPPNFLIFFTPLRSKRHFFTMWILPLVGYLGIIVGFSFLTLAIGKFSSAQFSSHSSDSFEYTYGYTWAANK